MTRPRFTNPVLGPRLLAMDAKRLDTDVLPNGRPAFRVTATAAMHIKRKPFTAAIDAGNFHGGDAVVAMADGVVSFVEPGEGIVRVDHGGGWSTGVGHMTGINVSKGQNVRRGHVLGYVGRAGTTEIHLHFDISHNGERLDPWPLLEQNQENDMAVPARLSALAYAQLGPQNSIRQEPSTMAPAEVTEDTITVQVFGIVPGGAWAVGSVSGTDWYWIGHGLKSGFVATALLPNVTPTALGKQLLPPPADTRIPRARTAIAGARQALDAAEAVLS